MLKLVLFCALLVHVTKRTDAIPIPSEETPQIDKIEQGYQKTVAVIGYIENFKTVMTEYVKSQYSDLTFAEIEEVKQTIEDFLTNFAKDMRDVVEKQHDKNEEAMVEIGEEVQLEEGLTDAQFDEIKTKIREEFPQISERSAQEIIVRLRNNLLSTRQKLDGIIRNRQRAQIENA